MASKYTSEQVYLILFDQSGMKIKRSFIAVCIFQKKVKAIKIGMDVVKYHAGLTKFFWRRKKMYANKVEYKDINKSYARLVSDDKKEKIYTFKAHSKSLKREINIVIVYTFNSKQKFTHKTYFSTDLTIEWDEILEMYHQRF